MKLLVLFSALLASVSMVAAMPSEQMGKDSTHLLQVVAQTDTHNPDQIQVLAPAPMDAQQDVIPAVLLVVLLLAMWVHALRARKQHFMDMFNRTTSMDSRRLYCTVVVRTGALYHVETSWLSWHVPSWLVVM
ncbi:hypothetical protein F5884DRAFT_453662 [Xylogone sp. PMI_703]|nr:hypothetical protein F5884DRAFT_453662 [Xylogone sp. PMI_703]